MMSSSLLSIMCLTTAAPVFDVTDAGAVADGKTDCTAAFQQTIDRAVEAGGGTIKIPAANSAYLVSKTLIIRGDHIVMAGAGATIQLADGSANGTASGRTTDSQVHVLLIHGTSRRKITDIQVLGLTIDCNIDGQKDYYNPRGLVVEYAEDVHIRNVRIMRPFVGLDIGAGSRNCEVRDCEVIDWTEDGFDASGDADKGSGAITENIKFVGCRAHDAPRASGNAWEIEDGVRHILVQDCVVENVPRGNGFGLRNHWKAGVVDMSRDVQLRRVKISNVGGKYGIYAHSAPRDRFPDNRYTDVRLSDVICDAPVLLYGPMERVSIQRGRYQEIFLGWDYDHSADRPGKRVPLANSNIYLRDVRIRRLDVMAADARVKLRNVLIDGRGTSPHGIRVVAGTEVQLTNCTVTAAQTGVVLEENSSAVLRNSIVWGNESGVVCRESGVVVDHCCIQGQLPSTVKDRGGNTHDAPKFVTGPGGKFYLAGGDSGSPCIDAGRELAAISGLDERSTQSDGRRDRGLVDLGFHYAIPSQPVEKTDSGR